MRLTLTHLQKHPEKLAQFKGKNVRIWSGEWGLWWRANAAGYTRCECEAGVYPFAEAWAHSMHCGPEKRIAYQTVDA